jgi:hypothetical protein
MLYVIIIGEKLSIEALTIAIKLHALEDQLSP